MANTLTGACLCGAVRYECSAQPLMSGNCHCRDCQKSSGGGFVAVLAVSAASLKIQGQVNTTSRKPTVATLSHSAFARSAAPACLEKLPATLGSR